MFETIPRSSSYCSSTRGYVSPPGSVASPASSASSWGTVSTQPPSLQSPVFYPSYSPSFSPLSPGLATGPPPILHPILQRGGPPFDLRKPPVQFNDATMLALTSQTTIITQIRIYVLGPGGISPEWYIDVVNPRGVMVRDVFSAMYSHFHQTIQRVGMANTQEVTANFRRRAGSDRNEYCIGAKVLDRLNGRFMYDGLKPYGNTGLTWTVSFT